MLDTVNPHSSAVTAKCAEGFGFRTAYRLGRRSPAARALAASCPGTLLLLQQLGAEAVERGQVLGRGATGARRAREEGHSSDVLERDWLRRRTLGAEEALEMVD